MTESSEAANRLNAVILDFEAALDRLNHAIDHVVKSKPRSDLLQLLLNSCIVSLSAVIEEALRALFQEYLLILEEKVETHAWLRADLQKSNVAFVIDELRQLNGNGQLKSAAAIVANLELCVAGKPGFRLMREAITYNKANFKSKQVTDTANACGFPEIWLSISDSAEVESYIGEGNLGARVNRLIAAWNELFDERDLVVHRLSQASGWGDARILQAGALSRIVLQRIAECLSKDVYAQLLAITYRQQSRS